MNADDVRLLEVKLLFGRSIQTAMREFEAASKADKDGQPSGVATQDFLIVMLDTFGFELGMQFDVVFQREMPSASQDKRCEFLGLSMNHLGHAILKELL